MVRVRCSPRLRRSRLAALTITAALVAGACSSSGGATPGSTTTVAAATSSTTAAASPAGTSAGAATVPTGDIPSEFFVAPDSLPASKPGDILRTRPIAAPAGTKGYAVLYRSTTVDGSPTAVSGVVFTPDTAVTGTRDILAWAHGTTGLGDSCATSQQFATGTAVELAIVTFVAQQGLVFVATDYQGLGTPGPHPYLVNQAAGRDVLDSIRAAQSLPGAGTSAASRSVVWGHSQGGGAGAVAPPGRPTT